MQNLAENRKNLILGILGIKHLFECLQQSLSGRVNILMVYECLVNKENERK